MKKLSILTLTVIALTGFMATTVRAQSPHYIKGPTASLESGTDYVVTFKEAGLGSSPVTYTLKAGAGTTFTYQCFTKSGNNPQGAPNGVDGSNLTTTTTITPHNGNVSASIEMAPDANPPLNICKGGGLVLRLIAVDYDNVTFSDGVTVVALPDICAGD